MNDYWHIPRASLASSSSAASSSAASLTSSSNRSTNSNPPTMGRAMVKSLTTANVGDFKTNNRNQIPNQTNPPRIHQTNRNEKLAKSTKATTKTNDVANGKRGSRSSQGSSDSNNSTRSAASGSLLLTAANLERFAEIHKKQEKAFSAQQQHQQQQQRQQHNNKFYLAEEPVASVHNTRTGANYNANLVQALATGHTRRGIEVSTIKSCSNNNNNSNDNIKDNDTIIEMDPNLDFVKTKDLDTVSIASSMHFTMVNGESGSAKKQKRGLCDRGRQVTVLIVSMSTVFLLLIMGMVYALEMRARDMPQS